MVADSEVEYLGCQLSQVGRDFADSASSPSEWVWLAEYVITAGPYTPRVQVTAVCQHSTLITHQSSCSNLSH